MKKEGMTPAYQAALAGSYAGQNRGFFIPRSDEITVIPLGFQPMGMSVMTTDDETDHVAITAYYQPAICTMRVELDTFGLICHVDWIRNVDHEVDFDPVSVRIFPGSPTFADMPRAQTAILNADGTIWTSRNGERSFFVLSAPNEEDGRRRLVGKFTVPADEMSDQIHSAMLYGGSRGETLSTVETSSDQKRWFRRSYSRGTDNKWKLGTYEEVDTFTYGVALRREDSSLWTIKDFRSNSLAKGLYRDDELVLPASTIKIEDGHDGLCGNGLAFLRNGSLLITRYGEGSPGCWNGIPGALIHVPAALLA